MTLYRVLLVDDEERIRKGIKKLLEEVIGGYTVVAEAGNGKKALECLLSCKVDLIFTDIRMPEMDGIELIRKVRQQLPQIPIFVLSGYDEYEYMREALKSNATDYILKPVDRVELAQSLHKLREVLDGANNKERSQTDEEAKDKDKRQVIRRVKEIVSENLHKEISLQSIAEKVNYSYTHLSALFKNETGQPFSDYLTKVRIEKAKQLLRETQLKIYEVGSLCGYHNPKYFMSIFKETVGITPSDYRDQYIGVRE